MEEKNLIVNEIGMTIKMKIINFIFQMKLKTKLKMKWKI